MGNTKNEELITDDLTRTVFLKSVKQAITNLLINNPNYVNGYYGYEGEKMIKDTKERAKYILDLIDQIDHLI